MTSHDAIFGEIRKHLGEYPTYMLPKKNGNKYSIFYGKKSIKEDPKGDDPNGYNVVINFTFEERQLLIVGFRNTQEFVYCDSQSFDLIAILGFISREVILGMNFQHMVDVQALDSLKIFADDINKKAGISDDRAQETIRHLISRNAESENESMKLRNEIARLMAISGSTFSIKCGVAILRLVNATIVLGGLLTIWYIYASSHVSI